MPCLTGRRRLRYDRGQQLLEFAFTGGLSGVRGLDVGQLWDIGRLSTGGLEPDLTIVLDLRPQAALERRNRAPDRMEKRSPEFYQRVREGFLAEAWRRPDRIRVIDAVPSVEVVHALICKEVERVLGAGPRT